MNELKIRKIQGHLDDRGILYQPYAREYDLKRIYVIRNWKANIIRAFHKHNEEFKAYFVVQGTVKFIVIINDKPQIFILSDKELSVLEIPPKYLHGWMSLTDDAILIGMSNKTLQESLNDDIREDPFKYGKDVWETKSR